jgi:hypothetical protein
MLALLCLICFCASRHAPHEQGNPAQDAAHLLLGAFPPPTIAHPHACLGCCPLPYAAAREKLLSFFLQSAARYLLPPSPPACTETPLLFAVQTPGVHPSCQGMQCLFCAAVTTLIAPVCPLRRSCPDPCTQSTLSCDVKACTFCQQLFTGASHLGFQQRPPPRSLSPHVSQSTCPVCHDDMSSPHCCPLS